ncbi:alpha/beta hydrolase [Fulvivirgaceae bacterium PWU4]|uniref:Alpha/beta hydrolase n=1 Tax=Chryseosolibacter histidini TaxID=2782349 RepID=A0AAP2DRZ8_9BACT|nr:alpha/beta hydrolase [Chryseosolibacter histidini]MBT1701475.1 alpha/beta hydrolase [Chryseosolibacter histidini]
MKSIKLLLSALLALLVLQACMRHEAHGPAGENNEAVKDPKTDSASFTSGYSDVNGIRMYYEIHGSGKPLVLIHGGGSTIETTFGRIIPYLSQHRQVIAVELQAHGHTADRNADLSFEQDADDVAALLKNLGIDKADIFGFSNGGTTALQIAIRHPELTGKVVAGSALLKRNGTLPQFWEFMKQARITHMPQQYKDAYLKITGDSARLQNMHDKCAKRMNDFSDVSDARLRSIKSPVLLVNGDADVATSEHMVQVSRLIPGCRLAIIPGSHGEYVGEITTLKPGRETKLTIMPILEEFLEL